MPASGLFEEADDLLIGKSGLFQSRYSPKLADFVPSLWYGREGAGHWETPKDFALKNGATACLQNNGEPDLLTSEWKGKWL